MCVFQTLLIGRDPALYLKAKSYLTGQLQMVTSHGDTQVATGSPVQDDFWGNFTVAIIWLETCGKRGKREYRAAFIERGLLFSTNC